MKNFIKTSASFLSIFILTLIIGFFAIRLFNHFHLFREHRIYLQKPISEQSIEFWMPYSFVIHHFDCNENRVNEILDITKNDNFLKTKTIEQICVIKNINCVMVIKLLNEEINDR